jgi:HK97 family phage major capsid protein
MADSSVGFVVNGHATVIQPDALISLIYSLPAYYRGRGAWIMNGTTSAAARKLKDGQNNYLSLYDLPGDAVEDRSLGEDRVVAE